MTLYLIKLFSSALIIVLVTELTKRTGYLGALIAALPLVSLISIFWIYFETKDIDKIREFSWGVFWFVLPSLAFFLSLPKLLERFNLFTSMAIGAVLTIFLFWLMVISLQKFGIKLL